MQLMGKVKKASHGKQDARAEVDLGYLVSNSVDKSLSHWVIESIESLRRRVCVSIWFVWSISSIWSVPFGFPPNSPLPLSRAQSRLTVP
jgi:hypothetical protein